MQWKVIPRVYVRTNRSHSWMGKAHLTSDAALLGEEGTFRMWGGLRFFSWSKIKGDDGGGGDYVVLLERRAGQRAGTKARNIVPSLLFSRLKMPY